MCPRSDQLFRRAGRVSLLKDDGVPVTGFGVVFPWEEEKGDLWGERSHVLGRLTAPLYQFVGSLPEVEGAQGAKLTQGEQVYRVLRGESVAFGGNRVFERALLERWEEDADN